MQFCGSNKKKCLFESFLVIAPCNIYIDTYNFNEDTFIVLCGCEIIDGKIIIRNIV